ncbi:nuclear GTP-binding protein nug1 [Coemansia aciculifera]|uniref:Nuclear GTP-binding protein nug1 n=1 Tax=Coemansia aciculifera TaxID=417176 RepID=A0ACC1M7E0_9FUNG|nr:nuclear GTP-binding protein nug1 [Coemansia aciculifera]KAJ2909237.1 nuclear GTP-binding protein nug1 [Coemansia aciculifera]
MVPKKHKSKRLTINHQKKIHKRSKEKHRKDKRDGKRSPHSRKLKKDPGIPNLLPFKDKILKEVEDHREQIKEERLRQKEARSQLHESNRTLTPASAPKTIADLARDAKKREAAYEEEHGSDSGSDADETIEGAVTGRRDNSKRAYYREFQKVVQHADVILEVLDARDPLGTRAPQIERMIMDAGANKRIILVLNKIDLVPRDVVEKWLAYLRHEYPTLAFKASTQEQRNNLGHAGAGTKKVANLNTSVCVGAESIIQLLKNYSRNHKIKTSITVGVIGFPNVGKSSLINSLKRSRVCGVGSTPGFTKFVQEIHLDSKLKLLDCPGIVFNSPVKSSQKLDKTALAEMMLRNCIKVELLEDPIAPVDLIVQRCKPAALQALYNVPAFLDTRDFLVRLARQRGFLKRQGIADLVGAARIVLDDWNKGKIPYYTLPPGMAQSTTSGKTAAGDAAAAHGAERAMVVSQWAKEFDIDALLSDMDSQVLVDAKLTKEAARRAMVTEGKLVAHDAEMASMDSDDEEGSDDYSDEDMASEDDEEEEEEGSDAMEEDDSDEDEDEEVAKATTYIVNLPDSRKTKTITRSKDQGLTAAEALANPQSNRKLVAEQRKKQKKQAKRSQAQGAEEEMAVEESDDNDEYNFGTYFKKPVKAAAAAATANSDTDEDL